MEIASCACQFAKFASASSRGPCECCLFKSLVVRAQAEISKAIVKAMAGKAMKCSTAMKAMKVAAM